MWMRICLLRVSCLVFKGISFVILGLSGVLVSGISVINTATKSNQGRERVIWPSHAGHSSSHNVRAGAQDGSLKQRPEGAVLTWWLRLARAVQFLTLSGTTCSGNGVAHSGLGPSHIPMAIETIPYRCVHSPNSCTHVFFG